ncbi:DNA-binding transcriptional regulator, ArsR family [Streptomyces sp. Ncost-T10-10d]|nr:DNA-binding transcriptional regulator, ArsR family [Streptomyces sp. Ncost-T10-10d]
MPPPRPVAGATVPMGMPAVPPLLMVANVPVLVRVVGVSGLLTHGPAFRRGTGMWTPQGALTHYVHMSARMHLSPAHSTHPRDPGAEQLTTAAAVLGLLADRTRLALVHTLGRGEADVTTLTAACGAARPAVSQHLAKLRLAGLVSVRKEGRRMIYGLPNGHLRRVVDEVLNLADHHLSGAAVHD